jgi:hypothetical protein
LFALSNVCSISGHFAISFLPSSNLVGHLILDAIPAKGVLAAISKRCLPQIFLSVAVQSEVFSAKRGDNEKSHSSDGFSLAADISAVTAPKENPASAASKPTRERSAFN